MSSSNNRIVTTFMFPDELGSIDEAKKYIALCIKRRDSYARLPGAPRKRAVNAAWNERIEAAEVRLTQLETLAKQGALQ